MPYQFEKEEYKCTAVNTGVLTAADKHMLGIESTRYGMILERDTGWFMKLFEEHEYMVEQAQKFGERAMGIIIAAHMSGYRMIEFDIDANVPDREPEPPVLTVVPKVSIHV